VGVGLVIVIRVVCYIFDHTL